MAAIDELAELVRDCPDQRWHQPAPDDGWSIAIVADHAAAWTAIDFAWVENAVNHRPYVPLSHEIVEVFNDRRAREHAGDTRKQVLELLASDAYTVSTFIAGLSDEVLAKQYPMSVLMIEDSSDEFHSLARHIETASLRHFRSHTAHIR